MNNITITGNLTKDADVRQVGSDQVSNFTVADNQGKDKPAIFWNCSLFGKRAESLSPYLKTGQSVTVIGQVTERKWTDKEGQERKSMDIRVGDVALQGGKRDESAAPRPAAQAPRKPQSGGAPNLGDMDDDIPFAPVPRKALHSI
jgi:single-strand DNA-binding protein